MSEFRSRLDASAQAEIWINAIFAYSTNLEVPMEYHAGANIPKTTDLSLLQQAQEINPFEILREVSKETPQLIDDERWVAMGLHAIQDTLKIFKVSDV